MSTQDKVRSFIVEELQFDGSAGQLSNDYPLLEREVIDSMGIFQIVSFLESEFGVEIDDEDLVPEHFATIDDISQLVDSKLA